MKIIKFVLCKHNYYLKRMLFFLFCIVLTTHSFAQNQKVSLSKQQMTVLAAFEEIEKQTQMTIAYNESVIDVNKQISASIVDKNLSDALSEVLKGSGASFSIKGKQIIIVPDKKQNDTKKITGTIKDDKGEPVIGATVLVKGTTIGTITDIDGNYTLDVDKDAVLQISYIGYLPKEMKVGDKSILDIQLNEDTKILDEVVVVGYGIQKKRDVTTSIASMRASDLENQPVGSFTEAMVGKLPGVQISQSSGAPGAALSVKVRGTGTITAGSSPLYVVDGLPLTEDHLNTFNMNDIETIEVLKDASSAAIYGSRGSNGVVIITTKSGKEGKAVVSFGANYGWQSIAKKIDMMDAYQYAELVRDARNNSYFDAMQSINKKRAADGLAPISYNVNDNNSIRLANSNKNNNTINPTEIVPYLEKQPGLNNTDWQDEIYRTAPIQNYNVSVSGGSSKIRYFSSLEYLNQQGIIINSDFERYSARLNMDITEGILKTGFTFTPSVAKENKVKSAGTYSQGGVVSSALHYAPIWPVYKPDGTYDFSQNSWSGDTRTQLPDGSYVSGNSQTQAWNPVALAMLNKDERNFSRMLGSIYAELSLMKQLKYRISLGMDLYNSSEDTFSPSTIPLANTAGNPESEASGTSETVRQLNWVLEQTLTYNYNKDKHNLNAVAGWIAQEQQNSGNYMYANGFITNDITTLNAGTVTRGNSTASEWTLLSGLARVQYDYDSKYLLSAAFRSDGSSKFGKNNKWGMFPSFSAGWRISEEQFMNRLDFINDFKLRVSYGLTGNFQIPAYGSQGEMEYDGYVLGGNTPGKITGAAPVELPNPNLQWEKTSQLNLGFDGTFFNNVLTLGFDWYNSNTYDLLLKVPVPLSTGYTTQLQNIGEVRNRGVEFTLGTNVKFGEVSWQTSFNISANRNKVMALGPGNADIINTGSVGNAYFITRVGEAIGSYYLPVVDGIFMSQEEIDNYPHYTDSPNNYDLATAKPGDFKFRDVNGDGKLDLGDTDRDIVGNYMPDFIYGFNTTLGWRGVDFSLALQGVQGNEILNLSRRYFYNFEGNMNNYKDAETRWISPENPGDGKSPRANRVAKGSNGTTSTWHVEDGSYLRIRNITLGYTFPKKVISKIYLSNARVYCSLQNPFTFTKYSGYNPEVSNRSNATTNGEDYGVYPVSKTVSFGVNVTF